MGAGGRGGGGRRGGGSGTRRGGSAAVSDFDAVFAKAYGCVAAATLHGSKSEMFVGKASNGFTNTY